MNARDKLQAIYEICLSVKDGETYVEESVIDEIMALVTFDKHDVFTKGDE